MVKKREAGMTEKGKSENENFNRNMTELFSDVERLDALLLLEKSSRGVDQKQLVGHHITFEQVEAVEKSHYGTQALPDETYEVSDIEIEIKGSDVDYATSGSRIRVVL